MLRHQAFYDVLADAGEHLPIWRPTVAGLAVLDLVDAIRLDRLLIDSDWTGVRAVTDSVTSLREGHPLRRPLLRTLELLRDEPPSWSAINSSLFVYGRALDFEGSWSLAADVFAMVAEIAREERQHEVAIEATTALGGAARRSGDWDRSAEGYAEAAHLAETLGDQASGLTVRVGTANTQIARGNLPAAQSILEEVIGEAERAGLDGVQALAYHARATVAHNRGEFGDAVGFAYRALERTSNPSARDAIMADIAAAFAEMGRHDAARDAHMILSLTSRYQWVRAQATINLMELAAIDGMEAAFDSHASTLRNSPPDPRLQAYFLLYYGEGCLAFGREAEGLASITEARDFASSQKIHQVAHEAAAALAAGTSRTRRLVSPQWEETPPQIAGVVMALEQLRETALATTGAGDRGEPTTLH